MTAHVRLFALAGGLALSGAAQAHSFGKLYNLPVPFWLYVYGASAALALSFLLVAFFVTGGAARVAAPIGDAHAPDAAPGAWRGWAWSVLRGVSLGGLLLCVLTGLFGSANPYLNFSMTFFWIVFVLGFAYLTALCGDLYAAMNPWRTLVSALDRVWPAFSRGRAPYPRALATWPALAFYMAFIWIELFGHTTPHSLALALLGYSACTLLGLWRFGAEAWFRHGEFFGVFFRLIARMAPLDLTAGRLRWRRPFVGLLDEGARDFSEVLFALFMLSSTAYDGLRDTLPWVQIFWADRTGLITAWLGQPPVMAYLQLRPVYAAYESLWLLASPFIYLAVYVAFIALAKTLSRSTLGVRELALRFAYTLLPIALVYNVTHYFTLILTQGVKIVSLLSDPFGWGWNLLGTAGLFRAPIFPDMGTVWHTQVALILVGHVVSVYLAHVEALRSFGTRRAATLSQLPMLALMMLFTAFGLWILAQPISSGG
ncbi:MAG: hypothetical protein E6R07_14770 [Nevskiaceae bacterium]|nr:MAG: hypothetical protein E6R07_14770 [Nevskiaceae bacterium]